MPIGVVQEIGKSGAGNPKLKIEGIWYSAGRCDVTGAKVGDKIEYVYNEFGEPRNGKRLRGLDKWRPVVDASGTPETGSTVSEADILRSVSNVVGNLCASGVVKTPEELEKWFVATHRGFLRVSRNETTINKLAEALQGTPEREAGSDDEHDFDDSAELEQMAAQAQSRERTRVW